MTKEQLFDQGVLYYDNGDFTNAFNFFKQAADLGEVSAMSNLAVMYSAGLGVSVSLDQSIYWNLKAIEEGNSSAILNLGITYKDIGDFEQAKFYFEKALNSGDGEAALELAKIYAVSGLDSEKIKQYLIQAIASKYISDDSVDEAKLMLATIKGENSI